MRLGGTRLIYLLVILWAAAFALSIIMAVNVAGERNLDTGFARLDVLMRGQIIALALAIFAAVAGFLVADSNRSTRLVGLAPLALTVLLVGGLFVVVTLRVEAITAPNETLSPTSPAIKPIPTEPVQDQGVQDQG